MRQKLPDGEIAWALATLDADAAYASEFNAQSECEELRRMETLVRRLAREAGYDLSKLLN